MKIAHPSCINVRVSWWSKIWGGSPRAERPPSWAPFEDIDDFEAFVDAVHDVLQAKGVAIERSMVRSGSVVVMVASGKRKERFLHTLAERCATSERQRWPAEIERGLSRLLGAAHVGGTDETEDEAEERPRVGPKGASRAKRRSTQPLSSTERPASNEALADLRVQLFSDLYLSMLNRSNLVSTKLGEGIHQVLVHDVLGAAEQTVARGEANGWRRTDEDLLALGRENAVAADAALIQRFPMDTDAGRFELLVSNGFYMGACVIEGLERTAAEAGTLVVFLTWHHVLVHTIDASTTRATLDEMRSAAGRIATRIEVAQAEWLATTTIFWHPRGSVFTRVFSEDLGEDIPVELARRLSG